MVPSLTKHLQLLKVRIIHLLNIPYYGGAGRMSDGHLVFTANGANAAGQQQFAGLPLTQM